MRHLSFRFTIFLLIISTGITAFIQKRQSPKIQNSTEWNAYNGGAENTHFSSLKQINRANVKNLKVAWTYDTNDAFEGAELQCNPIIANGMLYATSPKMARTSRCKRSSKIVRGLAM